eukprot:CAMPEP_0176477780 /NCGR_PEP_ID=MMETSP0200_2-20121128/821_1 /TAXON_ID=947934 /ORGANISM="Chaetoceros sp., Strain GSL56" /LENGTH=377 /DNA_ID=CAMNT_0017873645 /DNA_START=116 /DNA_END=1250 /DNA_ORIENTATION=+
MTKHRDNNFTRSYRAEMCVKIASTLAGFLPDSTPNDSYFVPRANLKLPNNLDNDSVKFAELINHLFPPLQQWKHELASNDGDKEHQESASHFLNVVIPWFTKILLQDAVIWMKEFPANSAKNLLLHKLAVDRKGVELLGGQNFSQWAALARKEIKRMISEHEISEEAKQLSNEKLIELLVTQQSQINNLQQQLVEHRAEQNTKHREIMDAISKQLLVQQPNNTTHHDPVQGTTTITGNMPNINQINIPGQPDTLRTIDEALNHGGDPIIPVVWQINKYESVENLSLLGEVHNHKQVTTALLRKSGPLYVKKDHWVKIARIRKRVKDYMKEKDLQTELDASREIDSLERQGLSLNQYAEFLRTSQEFQGMYSGKRRRL